MEAGAAAGKPVKDGDSKRIVSTKTCHALHVD
jgi:hypothetical protein